MPSLQESPDRVAVARETLFGLGGFRYPVTPVSVGQRGIRSRSNFIDIGTELRLNMQRHMRILTQHIVARRAKEVESKIVYRRILHL